MAENYRHLYEQMKRMVEKYQDEIVPGLRKVNEDLMQTRVEVVRCKDCKHWHEKQDGAISIRISGTQAAASATHGKAVIGRH